MDAKVQDYPDLIKRNGGVVNTNVDEYQRARMRAQQVKRINTLESKVESMDGRLSEILSLLQNLAGR